MSGSRKRANPNNLVAGGPDDPKFGARFDPDPPPKKGPDLELFRVFKKWERI